MARKAEWPPRVRSHRGVDYIRVSVGAARRKYTLGPAGSEQSRREYLRVVAELETDRLAAARGDKSLTVAELAGPFLERCGREVDPKQVGRVVSAVRPLLELYGHTPASAFGPLALETVRNRYVAAGYSRGVCNSMTSIVRQLFKWAASRELVAPEVHARLATLAPLLAGKTAAPDRPRVRPPADGDVEKTLYHLSATVGAMVRFQLLTGCRPGEACLLRPCDLVRPWKDFGGVPVWLYHLDNHKTSYKGGQRDIAVGPKAQAVLAPFLDRPADAYCFSPREAVEARRGARRALRKSPVQPSQVDRRTEGPRRAGERYSTHSYGDAIERACKRAGVPRWAPNQLRHAAGTRVRADHSREDARAVLGHSDPSVTDVYAESCERAGRVAARDG